MFTVQKRAKGEKAWTTVGTRDSLDEAIVLATRTENHPSPLVAAARSSIVEVWARVVEGRKVIWK